MSLLAVMSYYVYAFFLLSNHALAVEGTDLVNQPAACSAYKGCGLLSGNCCPNPAGTRLDCCNHGLIAGSGQAPAPGGSTPIVPNWDLLTNFTATYTADAHIVLQMRESLGLEQQEPLKSYKEKGTISADIFGERLRLTAAGHVGVSQRSSDGQLSDGTLHGNAELMFDAPQRTLGFRGRFRATSKTVPYANGHADFCVKLRFPAGLVPEGILIQMEVEQYKPQLEAYLRSIPHRDVTIDDENIAIIDLAPSKAPAHFFVGLRHNAVPFGAGIVPQTNSPMTWDDDIFIKFPTWKQGASDITDFSCSASASASLAELVANEAAMQQLKNFDKLLENLRSMGVASNSFSHLPARPSLVFEDAAMKELSAMQRKNVVQQFWPVVATGGAAGMAGCLVAIGVIKLFATKSSGEPLLGNIA